MNSGFPLSFSRHGDTIGLWLAIAVLVAALGIGVKSTLVLTEDTSLVEHTHRVIESLDQLVIGIASALSARRGFALTGDQGQLDGYTKAVELVRSASVSLRSLPLDNSMQQRRLDELEPLVAARITGLDVALAAYREHGFDADREARQIVASGSASDEIWRRAIEMKTEERRLLVLREQKAAQSVVWSKGIEAVGACFSLALLIVVVARLRREIRRREQSEQAVRKSETAVKLMNDDLERRVEERTTELRTANAELESFGYAVVHHLRAPLRGMGGFAEILLEEDGGALTVDARESLDEIRRNAAQMAASIDALVSMSRVTRRALQRKDVDLTEVARTVVAGLVKSDTHPAREVSVQEGLHADVDPSLARTLLEILLGNAWKFTGHQAAPRIEVGCTELDSEPSWFVRDNGVGLDMAHSAKLFAPFGRLHTLEEFPGVGIGLATAQRIVQRHGGRIWADGRVGEGAVVHFTLGHTLPRGSI